MIICSYNIKNVQHGIAESEVKMLGDMPRETLDKLQKGFKDELNKVLKGAKEDKKISYKYTKEIVCPYCGHEFKDSWEASDGEDDKYCETCQNEFGYERVVTVEYISYKK